MFHRRLVLVGVLASLAAGTLVLATGRLTTGSAVESARDQARQRLEVTQLTPTIRGRIFDSQNRVLAEDEPGWEVAVNFSVIKGTWAYEQAKRAAHRKARHIEGGWEEMTDAERRALIQQHEAEFDQQARTLWSVLADVGQLNAQEIEARRSRIVSRVQEMQYYMWSRWRRRMEKQLGEDVPLASAVAPIAEQRQHHAILPRINDRDRRVIERFIAAANQRPTPTRKKGVNVTGQNDEGQAGYEDNEGSGGHMRIWREVTLRRPTERRYPIETMTVMVDRSSLPPPLRSEQPMEVTVKGVGMHVLGRTREVQAEDVKRRPFRSQNEDGHWQVDLGGYLPNDRTGASGVEASMERRLRGKRGRLIHHLDTGRDKRLAPTPGRDVHLTINARLQARVQAIMSPKMGLLTVQKWHGSTKAQQGKIGEPLNGAAVVLDAQTSEVLAAVSMPAMPLKTLEEDPDKIFRNARDLPYLNRTVARMYEPGSTMKPVMLASSVAAGVHPLGQPIVCDGVLDPDHPHRHRCWIYKHYGLTHDQQLGKPDGLEGPASLEVSCNVFYYKLGRRMGVERTVNWYRRFALGQKSQCGLPEEIDGTLPDPADTPDNAAINMAIGQGLVNWTPMQAAAAFATLARGGLYIQPTLIRDSDRLEARTKHDLGLSQGSIDAVLEGMDRVVHGEHGTGKFLALPGNPKIFNAKGVTVYGKSGTADPGKFRWIDYNFDGQVDKDERKPNPDDHAWFVALVKPQNAKRPTHVIAVVSEYAGKGSQVSGPIANQIIHALQTEGYLPTAG